MQRKHPLLILFVLMEYLLRIKKKTLLSRTQWFLMGIAWVLTKFEVVNLQRIVMRERHRNIRERNAISNKLVIIQNIPI